MESLNKMEKPIKIKEETWRRLTRMKYTFDAKSIDEVIVRILAIINHFDLADELKIHDNGGK